MYHFHYTSSVFPQDSMSYIIFNLQELFIQFQNLSSFGNADKLAQEGFLDFHIIHFLLLFHSYAHVFPPAHSSTGS